MEKKRMLPEKDNLTMMDIFKTRELVRIQMDLRPLEQEKVNTLKMRDKDFFQHLSKREQNVVEAYLDSSLLSDETAIQRIKQKIKEMKHQ